MSEIDDLANRAVEGLTRVSRAASRFAGRLLIGTLIVCVGGFLLGVAALSGGIRSVWIVLGIVFGSLAIGSAFIARWRVGSVRRHVPELVDEVRTLVTEGTDQTRTVIETFTVDADNDGEPDAFEGRSSAIVMSRQMSGFRGVAGSGLESSARLSAALTALTSFPGLVLGAILVSLVFAFLGFIFLIALAL